MRTLPMVVAHRGASADAPENTLPAFELAWKQGADAIECDVWMTADGHLVCHHDRATDRSSGVSSPKHLLRNCRSWMSGREPGFRCSRRY